MKVSDMDLDKSFIVEELDRICASAEFRGKPVMQKLLTYLVTEYIEGRSDQIKGYSVGVDVFEQGKDFDGDKNPLVRISAGRLRKLLRLYYLEEGKQDPIRIDIPRGNYVPIINRNNETGGASPAATGDALPPSVAVLPFRNLTGNKDLNYLAFGFSQELSDALTRFDDFRIIGMSKRIDNDESAHPDVDPIRSRRIGFLIDGDIQASGKQVRISFRLIDTSDQSSVWGDGIKFNIEEDDLFALQEDITRQIASHIGGEYGKINQRRYQIILQSKPRSLSEQEVLLKYYHYATVLTQASTFEFQEAAFEALEREPDSCLLNNFVGDIYGNIYCLDYPGADEALEKYDHYVEKAYSINANHQLVRSSVAYKCLITDERERFFRLLDEGKDWTATSPIRLGGFALGTCLFGEWERGKALLDEVFDNNTHVPGWLHGLAALYHYRRFEYEKALETANKLQIPGLYWGPLHRTVALGQLGRLEEARKEFQALLKCRPNFVERGRYLMSILVKEASLLEHLQEGFGKIGVKLARF